MAKLATRISALVIALLFLITSVGFSVLVIMQSNQQSDKDKQAEEIQKAFQEQQNQQGACSIDQVAGQKQKEPAVYKPKGDVTKLEVTDIKVGGGQEVKAGDCLQVKYLGSLAKDGTKFDGNFEQDLLLKFQVGTGSVIPGWDQGLIGMKVGGERRLVIPSDLAYGDQATGNIPAGSDLVFDVVLLKIGE